MDKTIKHRLKNFVGILVLITIVTTFSIFLYDHMHTTTITVISTNPKNYVYITPVVNGVPKNLGAFSSKHSLTKTLWYGRYQISVYNQSGSLVRSINVGSGDNNKVYDMSLKFFSATPFPVYGGTSDYVSASSSKIIFVNSSSGLSYIDNENNIHNLFTGNISSAKWSNPTLGTFYSRGSLYAVNDNQVSLIDTPFKVTQDTKYAISSNGNIYVSLGGNLYRGTYNGNFKKIYSSSKTIMHISAANNIIAIIAGSPKANPDFLGNVILLDQSIVRSSGNTGSLVQVSPDGRYIAVLSGNEINIFNDRLDQVGTLSASGPIFSLSWGPTDDLFYSISNYLWEYSSSNQEFFQVSKTAGQYINGIFPGIGGNFVYLTMQNSSLVNSSANGNQLYKIPLKDQQLNYSFSALSSIFPSVLSGACVVSYVDFNSPTIYISYPSNYSQRYCSSQVNNTLNQYLIDPSKIRFVFNTLATN